MTTIDPHALHGRLLRSTAAMVSATACLFCAGCISGPYVETDAVYQDGFRTGEEQIYHDGQGGSEVISDEGMLPADETGADAIQNGTAGDGAPGMWD